MQYETTENTPLTSNDQAKLLIFALLLTPSIVFLGGIIPTIFLAFGMYMMRKTQDFSHIDVAFRNFRRLTLALALIGLLWMLLWIMAGSRDEFFVPLLILTGPAYLYFIAVDHLFYRPLKSHYIWVEGNGFFPPIKVPHGKTTSSATLDIIQGEMLKQYSVADELIKWAKLKDDGHISEEEFNEVRAKLLKK